MEATKEKHATHTPGPWHYTLADEISSGGVYGGEKCVCDIIPKELQVAYDCEEIEIANANARLIAAAPEMFEMCKLLLPIMQSHADDGHIRRGESRKGEHADKLRKVLAKIEGGEG